MTIYYRPCILCNAGDGPIFFLPVPLVSVRYDPRWRNEWSRVPQYNGAVPLSQARDIKRITIQGRAMGAAWSGTNVPLVGASALTYANARAMLETMEGYLDGELWFYRWSNKHLEKVLCADFQVEETQNWHVPWIDYSLTLEAGDPFWHSTDDLSATPGWWEAWVGNGPMVENVQPAISDPTGWGDSDIDPGVPGDPGGAPLTLSNTYAEIGFQFHGVSQNDDATTELAVVPAGPTGAIMQVIGVGIAGCSGVVPGFTGSTRIIVALASMGNRATCDVAYDEIANFVAADPVAQFTQGDKVYVRQALVGDGGGHVDISAYIHTKVVG